MGTGGIFRRGKSSRGVKLTAHVRLEPRLYVRRTTPLLLHMYSWRGDHLRIRKLYFLRSILHKGKR
jgi:hypothetical protein